MKDVLAEKIFLQKDYLCGVYLESIIAPGNNAWHGEALEDPCLKEELKITRSEKERWLKRRADKKAENRLIRLIRTNFSEKDLALHLTYEEEPTSLDLAKKDVQNFFRRLKRAYKTRGIKLKYIWVLDKGRLNGRLHFHTIISGGVDAQILQNIWGLGRAQASHLKFGKNALAGFVKYVQKCKLLYRRYSCSKNLDKPIVSYPVEQPTARDVYFMEQELDNPAFWEKKYPNYELLYFEFYQIDENHAPVIRLLFEKKRIGGNKNEPFIGER